MIRMEHEGAGARIRVARFARGMTQAQLAQSVGVSRSAVAQWETDRAGQIRGNLARIASALGVSVGHIVSGDAQADAQAEHGSELALLRLYRACDEADRQLLLQTALRLSRRRTAPGEADQEQNQSA
jgi:transcriptional regulator with XRE-family HTH domain